jgi:hypothetical protein
MGILDEAIREHLELKRQHGAGDPELKQLEDEAFGPPERPGNGAAADPLAEAPTEFLVQPETAGDPAPKEAEKQASRRESPSIGDLQEAPESPPTEEPAAKQEAPTEVAPVDESPAEEEHPAMEHETVAEVPEPEIAPEQEPEPVPEPEPQPEPEPAGPTTEERHAIAEQPTELFDIEDDPAEGPPGPSDEELVEEEIAEPRLAPTDPLAGLEEDEEAEVSVQGPAPEEDEDDEFWNEQRLSDELDQALEAPPESEPEPEPQSTDEHETPEPESVDEHEAYEPEPTGEHETEAEPSRAERDEDLLEETPDFLEETPEDDELWFEQKPPKDFDFDD